MTSVSGHLTESQFGPEYKDWHYPPPERLFEAPIQTLVKDVRTVDSCWVHEAHMVCDRKTGLLHQISKAKQEVPEPYSSGPIAIEKGST